MSLLLYIYTNFLRAKTSRRVERKCDRECDMATFWYFDYFDGHFDCHLGFDEISILSDSSTPKAYP